MTEKITPNQPASEDRRNFVKNLGAGTAGILAAGTAPYAFSQTNPIKWRLQTYSGAPLGAHVVLPQIEAFNKIAHGQMEIELYYADQLVPTDELFRAMQSGALDAVQSDDATMSSPVDISVSVDIFHSPPATVWTCQFFSSITGWMKSGLKPTVRWEGVEWISAGAWDPLHIFTREPIRSLARHERQAGIRCADCWQVSISLWTGSGDLALG